MTKKTSYTTSTKAAAPTAKTLELADIIAGQLVDHKSLKYGQELTPEFLEKEVTYINASNGLFKVTKKPIGLFIEEFEKYTTAVTGLAPLEAGVRLTVPKIPIKHLIQILSWYRDVNEKDGTEASNLFFWNHNNVELPTEYTDGKKVTGLHFDGQLVMYCPIQENSAGLSEFKDDVVVTWLRENLALYLEIHSHNTMDAFFSGTDNANENMTQFYAVWGRVDKEIPAFTMRYVVGDTRVIVPMSYVFDVPQIKGTMTETVTTQLKTELEFEASEASRFILSEAQLESTVEQEPVTKSETQVVMGDFQGPWPQLEYPSDWMGQHTPEKPYPRYGATGYYAGGTYIPSQYGAWDDYNYGYGYGAQHAQNRKAGAAGSTAGKQKQNPSGGKSAANYSKQNAIVDFKQTFGNPAEATAQNMDEIRAVFEELTHDNADIDIALAMMDGR